MKNSTNFNYNDGGRSEAGYKGNTGDCVTRSIAIATEIPYQEVYDTMFRLGGEYAESHRGEVANHIKKYGASPRNGVFKEIYKPYIESLGCVWTPTMFIGQGCKFHLREDELPKGRLIVSVSKHITCVIDGVINDLHDCSRNGTRCVYGYWEKI